MKVKDSDIREYAGRRWDRLSEMDRSYWAAEYRRNGSVAAQRISLALWQHMKSVRDDWPGEHERQQDLDHHIALKQLLGRTADAFSIGPSIQRS